MKLLVPVAVCAIVGYLGMQAVAAPTRVGRINVTATLTHATARQLGPKGRLSDASEQAWRITDRNGVTIGRLLMACRWVLPHARLCTTELQMPLGKITAVGSSPTPLAGEYAVTGGTGVYDGGGGTMVFVAIGLRKQVLLVTITT